MAEQWQPYEAPRTPPHGEPGQVRRRLGLVVAGGVVVLGGIGAGVTALVMSALDDEDGARSTTTTTTTTTTHRTEINVQGAGGVDLFTTEGTDALAAAVLKETGSTAVHEVVLLKVNAVITVPGDDGARTLVWDGRSMIAGGPVVSDREPFDLGRLDGAVVGRLCEDQALTCTAVVGRPRPGDDGAWITIAGLDGVRFADLQGGKP